MFAEKKQDVDAIHEYLLLKGVEAVSIHGGKGRSLFSCSCIKVYSFILVVLSTLAQQAFNLRSLCVSAHFQGPGSQLGFLCVHFKSVAALPCKIWMFSCDTIYISRNTCQMLISYDFALLLSWLALL